jgi:CysZ protein
MELFFLGVRDVARGWGALRAYPRLWKYVIAPALITAALLVGAGFAVWHFLHPVMRWVSDHLPAVLAHVAGSALAVVLAIVMWFAAAVVFVPLAGLIAGPFAERLSEHLEHALTGRPGAAFAFGEFVHSLVLSIAHSLRRLIGSLFAMILVFCIGVIPVIGTLAAIVAVAWLAAHSAAYDCYDAVLARRLMAYRAKLLYLRSHAPRTTGLGAAVAVMLMIPGVNLFALGLGAAGATVASLEQERQLASARFTETARR